MADVPTLTGMIPLIQVFDMPTAWAFYRDLLGFELVHCSPEVTTAEGDFQSLDVAASGLGSDHAQHRL